MEGILARAQMETGRAVKASASLKWKHPTDNISNCTAIKMTKCPRSSFHISYTSTRHDFVTELNAEFIRVPQILRSNFFS